MFPFVDSVAVLFRDDFKDTDTYIQVRIFKQREPLLLFLILHNIVCHLKSSEGKQEN